jgi:SulP family sulfate permease
MLHWPDYLLSMGFTVISSGGCFIRCSVRDGNLPLDLLRVTLADLSGGDVQRWIELASLSAFVFSGISILAYFLRLSSIINFISETVLLGFKAGAAVLIGLTQLPKLFGVKGGGESFYSRLMELFHQLPQTNFVVLIFGIISIFLL